MNLYKYLAALVFVVSLSQIAVYAVHPEIGEKIIQQDFQSVAAVSQEASSYRSIIDDESWFSISLSVFLGIGVAGATVLAVGAFIALSPVVGLSIVGGLFVGLISSGVFALAKNLF